jgi:hypothetical protein
LGARQTQISQKCKAQTEQNYPRRVDPGCATGSSYHAAVAADKYNVDCIETRHTTNCIQSNRTGGHLDSHQTVICAANDRTTTVASTSPVSIPAYTDYTGLASSHQLYSPRSLSVDYTIRIRCTQTSIYTRQRPITSCIIANTTVELRNAQKTIHHAPNMDHPSRLTSEKWVVIAFVKRQARLSHTSTDSCTLLNTSMLHR